MQILGKRDLETTVVSVATTKVDKNKMKDNNIQILKYGFLCSGQFAQDDCFVCNLLHFFYTNLFYTILIHSRVPLQLI